MTETRTLEGGCLCGTVRYRITGPIDHAVHCHCSLCRRAGGAPVATWVTVARSDFAVTRGELATFRATEKAERRFCAACGSPLTFDALALPDEIDVTAGTLDDPEAVRPQRHIWTANRLSWLAMADGLPGRETE